MKITLPEISKYYKYIETVYFPLRKISLSIYKYTHTCVFLLQFAEKFKSTRPSTSFTSTVNAEESENEAIYTEIGKFLSPTAARQVSSGTAKSL